VSGGSAPAILALDFDGVLCEGTQEYFEVSRRTYDVVWPEGLRVPDDLFPSFRDSRPVIESGWEMPVLLQALVLGLDKDAISERWGATRDALLARDPRTPDGQIALLRRALDAERRKWIDHDRPDWLSRHALYGEAETIRRVVGEPERVAIVTTKEGEFVRRLLDHWGIAVTDVQGKESGSHKCDNLRRLRAAYTADTGGTPTLWFVEDRLETLQCVRRHRDLDDVRLFLATWGYNTARTRDVARASPGIELLSLSEFAGGFSRWGGSA
jgi:phosphoglycolate phosphatase-like HAD superfamily hydrolase